MADPYLFRVDFEDRGADYSFTKPVRVRMFGEILLSSGEEGTSWRDVLVKVAARCYQIRPDIFLDDARAASLGVGGYADSQKMIWPRQFADGLYIETTKSADDIVRTLRKMLSLCRVPYDEVEITYRAGESASAAHRVPAPRIETPKPSSPPAPREAVLPRENPLPVREDFAAQNTPASSSVTRVVNFHDRGADYSRAEPVRVKMFGAPLKDFLPDWQDCSIHSWADVLTKVAAVLYRKYRDAFRSLRFYQNQVTYGIGNAEEARRMKMRSPKSIAGGVYIETHSDTNAKIARIRSLLDLCGVSYDNVEIVYRVPKVSPVSHQAALPVREKPGIQDTPRDTLTVDFEDERADYSFTKPVRVRLFGAPLSDSLPDWQDDSVDTWTDVLYKTAAALYLRFPAAFSSQRFYRAQDSLRIGNAKDAQRMRAFKKISDDLYIDTYTNTNVKIGQLRKLLWVCGVDSGALEIEYVRREGASSEPEKPAPAPAQMSPSDTRVRDAFYTYLVRDAGVSASSARYYVSVVRSAENIARERQLNPCSLFNEDKEVVRATVRALNQDPWFSAVSQDHSRFGVALGHLLRFFGTDGSAGQGTEADSPDDRFAPEQFSPAPSPASPSEDQMRDAFYTYLLRNAHMTNQAANNCVSAVKIAENFAREQGLTPCSLFDEDREVILTTVRALNQDPWFSAYNRDQHNRFSSAIHYLLEFSRGYRKPASEQPEPVSHREPAEAEVPKPEPEKPAPEAQKTYFPEQPEPVSHRETAEPEVPKPVPEKHEPEAPKPIEPEPVVKSIRQALPSEASRERMRQAFSDYLLNDARLAPSTASNYVRDVETAELYAREHGYSHSVLYTEDREEILAAVREFSQDSVFKRFNQEYHNHYSAAINQLLRFSRGYCKPASEQPAPQKTYISEQPEPVYHRETAEPEVPKPVPEKPEPEAPKPFEPEPAPVAENLSNTVTNAEVSEPKKASAKPRRGFGEILGSLLKFRRRDKSDRDALKEQPAPEPPAPAKPASAAPVSETPVPEPPPVSEKARPEGEVDIAVLERMYPKLKEELLAEMRREMAAKSPEPVQPAAEPVKRVEPAKPAPEPAKPSEPAEPAREGFLIVPARPDEPRLLCETVGRKITTLNFGLTFRLAEPHPVQDADFTLIFLDEEYRALTKPTRVLLRAGESQRVSFRLPARAQQLRICYLGVRSAADSEKTLSQLMPFPVSIVFAAADFEE